MNTSIGKRGLLAATVAGFFSVGAHAQQACQNEVQQLRTQLEQGSLDLQERQQIEDLLSRASSAADTQTCSALVTAARQRLNAEPGSLQARQGAQAEQQARQQAQPGQAQPGQSQSSQAGQAQSSIGQQQAGQRQPGQQQSGQAGQRDQGSASSIERETQARQGAQSAQDRETTDVQVDQPAANVEVDAGSPDVRVQQQPPQVTVQQQPPDVTITQPEPEVTVRQAEPQVSVTQGEPQVQVQQAEPEVQVRQSGEPDVQVRESDEPQVNVAGERSSQGERQQAQQAQRSQQEQVRPASNLDATEATQLVGSNVKTADGEDVGEISAVARSRADSDLYAIADVGGFFGIGERRVAVPLERADVDREGNLVTQMSRDELEQLREYDEQQFAALR